MTLAEWLAFIECQHPAPIALGLERAGRVARLLGQRPAWPLIVVGGTNGKGSTCAMLERILLAAGYRVGLYTSPHFLRYNERLRIAAQPVDDASLCQAFARVEAARATLFAPFVTTKPEHAGVGLALSRRLAEAAAGTLELIPSAKGAHFRLRLRAAP